MPTLNGNFWHKWGRRGSPRADTRSGRSHGVRQGFWIPPGPPGHHIKFKKRDFLENQKFEIGKAVYLKEGITNWIVNWEKNNWKTSDKKNVKNVDLWKKLKDLIKSKQIEWCWIKGHSGDEMNDLADQLAKKATPI